MISEIRKAIAKKPETELQTLKEAFDLSAKHAMSAAGGNYAEAFISELAGHIDSIYPYGTGDFLLKLIEARRK